MDHDDVLEQIELAAAEPDGLERLMAGDTPLAAAVVGHLAGCDPCTEEFRRLSRAAPLLRDLVRTTPAPDLRERTLAYVRTHGRPRDAVVPSPAAGATRSFDPTPAAAGRRGRPIALRAALAAVAVVSIAVGSVSYLAGRAEQERYANGVAGLEAVNRATLEVTADAAARRVVLTGSGPDTSGTLLFSPTTTKLVVVTNGLVQPPAGSEYRCWVEVDGRRQDVGRMFFGDELAFWVGTTPEVSQVPDGTVFGISLTGVASPSLDADPVIRGVL